MRAAQTSVLVVGSGGREHAIGWALDRSPRRPQIIFAPGNPGTEELGENVGVGADDVTGVVRLALERQVSLVVVGPEGPLVAGLADRLSDAGVAVMGPSAAASRIEGSKSWAKAFMARHGIPTASSATFGADELPAAREYVAGHALPVVLKADGLAAGKGVIVATTREEALEGVDSLLAGALGDAGRAIVVEQYLEGEEASVFAFCDGAHFVTLAPAQDHKRMGDGDTGPNTGGMGAYAPAPVVTSEVMTEVERYVIRPLLAGMAEEGHPYRGVLYAGLMIGPSGPRVVEFNCRLGDPEAQVVLPLVGGDVLELFERTAAGALEGFRMPTHHGSAACVVLASRGYPGAHDRGQPIDGLDSLPADVVAFHAGTRRDADGRLVTSGGRVLGVVGQGTDLRGALDNAYRGVAAVRFDGAQYRRDIGRKGLVGPASEVSRA